MERTVRMSFGQWAVLLLMAFAILWKGGKSLETTWLLGLLAALLAIGIWLQGSRRNATSPQRTELPLSVWVTSLLFILWTIASFLTSHTRNYGLDEVIRSVSFVLLFLWAARLHIDHKDPAFVQSFPWVLRTTAALAVIVGIAIYTLQPVNRFVGTFLDFRFTTDYWPNAWAQFVLLAWPMGLLIALRRGLLKKSWTSYVVLGFILSSLLLSYSRGALIAFGGQLIMMFILFGSVVVRDIRYRRILRSTIWSGAIAVLIILLTSVALFGIMNAIRGQRYDVLSVTEKATFTAAERRSSIDERSQFWDQARSLTMQRPLLGWGPYSFRFVQPPLMKNILATSDHPHSVFLKLAMERGIPAVVLFIAMFGSVLTIAIFSFLYARRAYLPETDAFTIMSITSLCGVLLHNLIDYNLQFVGISLPCVLALGLLVHPSAVTPGQIVSFRRWRIRKLLSRLEVCIAMLLLLVTVWEGTFLVTSSYGRHALARGDDAAALTWFRCSHLSLFARDLYLSEAQIRMRLGHENDAAIALDRYQALNAEDARLYRLRGELLLRQNRAEEAFATLETAYARGKYTDFGMLRLLLDAARKAGKTADVLPRKQEFDALFSAYADAIEQNTHFIALSHNVEELQAVSRLLSALYPLDAERYKMITRSAVSHAKNEREAFSARPPGVLW